MKTLVVAATEGEVAGFIENYEFKKTIYGYAGSSKRILIDILITGISVPNTIFYLTRQLEKNDYKFVINAGIAGTLNNEINIGEVVSVTQDCFADIGYEDGNDFVPFTKTSLFDAKKFPFTNGWLINSSPKMNFDYKEVRGITVNRVHGNDNSISLVKQLYKPDVESMEGAAFMFCCLHYHVNFIQLRAISNKVEKRNKAAWDIPIAIENLNKEVECTIKRLV